MNTKTLSLLILCLLLVPSIYAAKTLDQHNVELTPQENITFTLEENSYVKVRTYERSTILVNVEDTATSFTLTNIKEDGTAEVTIKTEDAREIELKLGEKPHQIPIKSAIPIIYIENAVYHDDDKEADRNVVLRITVPVVNKFTPKTNKTVIDVTNITTEEEEEPKDPYLKYFLIAIILLLVIIIILGPKPKKNQNIPAVAQAEHTPEVKEPKAEPESKESKPKTKKTKKKIKEEQRSEDLPDPDEK
ncbi:MAG: hypothetical protein WC595_01065 [Candidatus Nanoarchaeia archaeon]